MQLLNAPSTADVRAKFPSLADGYAFMDNAGGSQVPRAVADAIRDYMLTSYVQIGADYPASKRATQNVADAHAIVETLMGGGDAGRVILGHSSSSLFRMLADCYAETLQPGDEIIVAENGHEANVSPWLHLGGRGFTVKMWEADPSTGSCEIDSLRGLLSSRTKLVAFPHVSNVLGEVAPLNEIVETVHRAGARVVVDGVAYAPHLPMDVAKWGVDWYGFSCYKVFGPHIGALWGSHGAQAEVTGPGHSIVAKDNVPYKFELGGVNHECCAGLNAVAGYLAFLAGSSSLERSAAVQSMKVVDALERPLTEQFLAFLKSKRMVRIIGPSEARLPIVSFVHESVPSKAIADEAANHEIGMRWGNFYSYRLLDRVGVPAATGVARASFAHYNTAEEIDRLIRALDPIL